MGDHYPVTVIVTHWNIKDILKIHEIAMNHVPVRTSEIFHSPGNGWRSFMIVTDGFEISGDLHTQEHDKLKAFLAEAYERGFGSHIWVVSESDIPRKGTYAFVQDPRKYLGLPSDDPYGDD